MSGIADDEAEHAQLAWDFAEWLDARLSRAERDEVHRVCDLAIDELQAAVTRAPPLAGSLGLPGAAEARALFDNLRGGVWRRGSAEGSDRGMFSGCD